MYSQSNLEEFYELIGNLPNQEFTSEKHFDFIRTTNSIWPNQLLNLKTTKSNINKLLDIIEIKSSDDLIPKILTCNTLFDKKYVIDNLKARNYRHTIWLAMTHNLESNTQVAYNSNLTIKSVVNEFDLKAWLHIVEIELMDANKLSLDIFKHLLNSKNCYFFLGFENNKPVATALLFIGESNAGIYLVSTLKTHRNKGVGTQMIDKCLEQAKNLRCTNVIIQATNLGHGIYKSLGFKTYGEINVFRIEKTAI